jgi:hypothetical protein
LSDDNPLPASFTCPRCQSTITARPLVAAGFCVTCGTSTQPPEGTPSITCPACHMTSYHPVDIAEGFCDNCHDWTSTGAAESDDAMCVDFAVPRPYGRGARAGGAGGP